MQYYVYIIGNTKPVLYVGVTSNLIKRINEHKTGAVKGFSMQYNLHKLLYYEVHQNISEAILREKQLKHWNRDWKIELISVSNPEFNDLYKEII